MNTLLLVILTAVVVSLFMENKKLREENRVLRYKYSMNRAAAEEFMNFLSFRKVRMTKANIKQFNTNVAFKAIMRANKLD